MAATETDAIGLCSVLAFSGVGSGGPSVGQLMPDSGAIWSIRRISFSRLDVLGKRKPLWELIERGDSLAIVSCVDPGSCFQGTCVAISKLSMWVDVMFEDVTTHGSFRQGDKYVVTLFRRHASRVIAGILTTNDVGFTIADVLVGSDGDGGWNILFGVDGSILCGPILYPRHAILFDDEGRVCMI